MRALVAMSGGVDSSVAAALLVQQGHDVVGATMKLWGGPSDSGCCSVADVDDARRAAQQLGIAHHVFAFSDDFEEHVVDRYVADHLAGRTPNPCIECNRHIKFDRFLRRARQLGFDAIATGHHARVARDGDVLRLRRGADRAKDQSYVLHVLGQEQLAHTLLPVGDMTKDEVRRAAADLGLRTAAKPDSQEVCFIAGPAGRERFLRERGELHAGAVLDAATGERLGEVDAVELVTVGQRRGLGGGAGARRYAVRVDVERRAVLVGGQDDLATRTTAVDAWQWSASPVPAGTPVLVQVSAHGSPRPAVVGPDHVRYDRPERRVAAGQSVVLYDARSGDLVLGGGTAVDG